MPDVEATVDPAAWVLSADGQVAARATTIANIGDSLLLASTEVKALQTVALMAECAVGDVTADPDFGEVRRGEPFDAHFRQRRRAWVGGDADHRHAGWETFAEAGARFDAALGRYRGDLVVGTHGMILTAWLVRIGHVPPGESAARFWESLGLPDVVTIER